MGLPICPVSKVKVADPRPHKGNYKSIRTIKGIHPALWRWARARVALENRSTGELINELIEQYKSKVEENNDRLEMTNIYEVVPGNQCSVRGINPELWRWLRSRSILEDYYLSEVINELLYLHMITAEDPVPVIRTRYQECVTCKRLFETEREDSRACSNRCRVALHRRRRTGRSE